MKRIKFGFNNDQISNSSWEGIGIREGLMITEGNYLGTIGYEGNHYIVCEVDIPNVGNRIIIRQALCDLFADGGSELYLNQDETLISNSIEEYINKQGIRENIKSIADVIRLGKGIHGSYKSFRLLEMDDVIIATSILPEVFEEKNDAIKYCQKSISTLEVERNKVYSMQ